MKLQLKSRYLEILIVVAFVILFVYVVSMTLQVARGVSQTIAPPTHTVRLQVLNGCGVPKMAARVADRLSGYTDQDIRISIVDTDNFESVSIDSSFVISRDSDKTAALVLARKLGLDESRVTYERVDNNYRHVSVTLVVGSDHQRLTIAKPAGTQKQ